jgi:hypothetical protein
VHVRLPSTTALLVGLRRAAGAFFTTALLGAHPAGCAACIAIPASWCGEISEKKAADLVAKKKAQCGTCAKGERCNETLSPARCRPHPGGVGETCYAEEHDRIEMVGAFEFECKKGLSCSALGKCSDGSRGDPCSDQGQCAKPLVCHVYRTIKVPGRGDQRKILSPSATCQPASGAGEPCMEDADCTKGLVCRTPRGKPPLDDHRDGEPPPRDATCRAAR